MTYSSWRFGMKRVAILGYKPLSTPFSGYEKTLLIIARMIQSDNLDIKMFSFGDKDMCIREGQHIEEIVKAPKYHEGGAGIERMLNFASLIFLGYRPALIKLNNNKQMLEKLYAYRPDIIIHGDFILPILLEKYKKMVKNKVMIVSYTDEPGIIEVSFGAVYAGINNEKAYFRLLNVPLSLLKKQYFNYALYMYGKMINVSDYVVTPTELDKKMILKSFDVPKQDIFVIPPVYFEKKMDRVLKTVTSVKKIAFLGNYLFWPNREAVQIIEQKIAPKMQNTKFIIAGARCPKMKMGNVEYVGRVDNVERFLSTVDACIAPILRGTGMKTKIMDYFLAKRPVIGTPIAFAGYSVKNRVNAIIESNPGKFADKIMELDKDKRMLMRLQNNSMSAIEGLSEEGIRKKWIRVINKVM